MRLASFFAPLARSLARLSPRRVAAAPRPPQDPGAVFFRDHLTAHGRHAATQTLRQARAVGAPRPAKLAQVAAERAITHETHRLQGLIAQRGLSERRHIRARFVDQRAQLKLRQAQRQYGQGSWQAARAAQISARAGRALAVASADLYVDSLAWPGPVGGW